LIYRQLQIIRKMRKGRLVSPEKLGYVSNIGASDKDLLAAEEKEKQEQ
jgi:hypothetical protein